MTSFLLSLEIVLTILIVVSVLLQKSSSIGLGAYSGSNESMFGAKGSAGFLSKATSVLAVIFVINTLVMGYYYNKNKENTVSDLISTTPKVIADINASKLNQNTSPKVIVDINSSNIDKNTSL